MATGDFGKILQLVGSKNASVFVAALKQMSGGLQQFNQDAFNRTVSSADRMQEKSESLWDSIKSNTAAGMVYLSEGFKGVGSAFGKQWTDAINDPINLLPHKAIKNWLDGWAESYKKDEANYQESQNAKLRITQDFIQYQKMELAKSAFFSDKFGGVMADRDAAAAQSQNISFLSRFFELIRNLPPIVEKGESGYALGGAMSAGSSDAVVAFQKYQETSGNSVQKKQLSSLEAIERWTRETAQQDDQVVVEEIGDF